MNGNGYPLRLGPCGGRRASRIAFLVGAGLALALRAAAGPPFLTDDPEPVPYRHWEAYLFTTVDSFLGGATGQFPALEFNYGAAPDLQVHVAVPWAFNRPSDGASAAGFGDASFGFKFRFLQETEDRPQVGVFPMVFLATGAAGRGLGGGGSVIQLPVWAQESWGPWTTYGGGGYAINRTLGGRSYPFGGWLLQRDLGEKVTLGGEVFTQGRSGDASPGTTVLNAGGQANLTPHCSLLFSLGHSVSGARHRIAYLGLYWTWGPRGAAVQSALRADEKLP